MGHVFESSLGTCLAQLADPFIGFFFFDVTEICQWGNAELVVLRRSRCLSAYGDATVSNGTSSTRWLSGRIGPASAYGA